MHTPNQDRANQQHKQWENQEMLLENKNAVVYGGSGSAAPVPAYSLAKGRRSSSPGAPLPRSRRWPRRSPPLEEWPRRRMSITSYVDAQEAARMLG
jgi:hypothetical protein